MSMDQVFPRLMMTAHEFAKALLAGPDLPIGILDENEDEWPYVATPMVVAQQAFPQTPDDRPVLLIVAKEGVGAEIGDV